MTIDPRFSFWLSIVLAVLAVLAGAGSQYSDLGLSPEHVKAVLAGFVLLMGVGNAINAVLAAIPSKSDPDAAKQFYLGPKASAQPPNP